MPRRKERKKKKYLGHRSFGHGNVKNRRGSGNRGGRGAAGRAKHHFTWVTRYDPDYFGRRGFHPVGHRSFLPVINLYDIEEQARKGKLEKKEGKFYFEFKGKVLATGFLELPVHIKAQAWSKRCEEKVKKAGGALEKLAA
ncbi:MAG TPA: uL15 family ribosomal protein [Candidatus Bilamarchaeaceae archaeon]|nr:uL15 family ribosomal protein [Candidatus Bilamarchaeaceae archaeon]